MTNKVLIPATTLASTAVFSPVNGNDTGVICKGLSGSEVITLQVFNAVTELWENYGTTDGSVPIEIYNSAFSYRIVKPVTVNPVGVAISQNLSRN